MECDKIPAIIEMDSFNGDYESYEDAVYNIYRETFENNEFCWDNKPIRHKKHPLFKDKPGTFWHIVSTGNDEADRLPDLRRYERIAWPAYILSYCKQNCNQLLVWKNNRKGKSRIILWCRDIDYVVVLDERKDFLVFWTSYPVTYRHTREKLLKEYNEYVNNKS